MIEFMRKIEGSFKDTVISLFKTNTTKQTVYGRGEKLNKLKTQKLSDGKNKSIRNLFTLKKKRNKLMIELFLKKKLIIIINPKSQ